MLLKNLSQKNSRQIKIKNRIIKMRAASINTTMKSNSKVAPLSCHCKLSVLIPHLKNISAQQAQRTRKKIPAYNIDSAELLFKRYI